MSLSDLTLNNNNLQVKISRVRVMSRPQKTPYQLEFNNKNLILSFLPSVPWGTHIHEHLEKARYKKLMTRTRARKTPFISKGSK